MKHDNFTTWIAVATCRILYGPDRRAVADELRAHLEDHRDALMARGMDEESATKEALSSMGQAEEIAPQLAQLHKPFWGYMEAVTRVMAIVLGSIVLFVGLIGAFSFGVPWEDNAERDNFSIMEQNFTASVDLQQDVSAKMGPYTYTVTRVAVCPFQVGYGECLIRVNVSGGRLFPKIHAPLADFWATDNRGNLYYSDNTAYQGDSRIQVLSPQVFPFHASYDLIIRGFDISDPQWIELHYDRDGREAVLHIDLTGGGT